MFQFKLFSSSSPEVQAKTCSLAGKYNDTFSICTQLITVKCMEFYIKNIKVSKIKLKFVVLNQDSIYILM